MRLEVFRSSWGLDNDYESWMRRAREVGYDGVELVVGFPGTPSVEEMRRMAEANGLKTVGLVFALGDSVEDQVEWLRRAYDAALALDPVVIVCHGGWDRWAIGDAMRFYERISELERGLRVKVGHETHRRRVFYNPWTTRDILKEFPDLVLTCDLSHWVCVCEDLLEDEADILNLCAERCVHIHARVGYEEGPQVTDPRAPEAGRYLEAHERWWDMIWDAQAKRGMEVSTLTPEYGPWPYQHTQPYTNLPLADNWEISLWQAQRQAERFGKRA